jgi:hypothetical protein
MAGITETKHLMMVASMELVITAMIITIISAQFILYLCDH